MTWNYAYTPQIWLSLVTVLFLLALAFYSYRRRRVPGALPFIFGLLFGVLWMGGITLGIAAVDAPAKIFWIKFQAAWLLPSATAVTCFLLEYAWPGRWLTRRNLALLSIPCLLNVAMILTNDLHHLVWGGFAFDGAVIPLNGPGNWIFLVYAYGLGLLNLVVLVWLFIRSPQHRWPVALMLAGQIGGRVVYALEAFQVIQSDLPIEVIAFWFPIPMYVIALFGFRILNPIPLARQIVIDQMREGMLVVDLQGRVVSLNPAAVTLLGTPAGQVRGRSLREVLPSCPPLSESGLSEAEICLETGGGVRTYLLSTSSLKDWRKMEAGYLLLLHDITSRKQAEAALNKSQEIQRLIYDKSFDGISIYEEVTGEDKRILVDCNERYCQMAGRKKEELLAIQDTRAIQRSEQYTEDTDRAAVMAEQAFSGVFSWIRPDGKENIIEYKAAPIRVGDRFYTIGVDRDMTESRHTQEQILEQQRSLAMLHEREQLARELHDSTSQVLGYAGFQLEAISNHIQDGQAAVTAGQVGDASIQLGEAGNQLSRLSRIIADAQADIREYILNLRLAPSDQQPFFSTLQQYLEGFSQNYDLQAGLSIGPGINDEDFDSGTQLQLFRIIQEALSNARKHSRARSVQVTVEAHDLRAHICIQDNGCGFDPSSPARDGKNHFGLRSMRERAEQIGGALQVTSAPGQGTCVIVDVPLKG